LLQTKRLEESTIFEVVFDYDVSDCVEHKLNVVGISGAGEVSIDFFRVFTLVQVFHLRLDVGRGFVVVVDTWKSY